MFDVVKDGPYDTEHNRQDHRVAPRRKDEGRGGMLEPLLCQIVLFKTPYYHTDQTDSKS